MDNEETVVQSELDDIFPKSGLIVRDHRQVDDVDNNLIALAMEQEEDGLIPPETPAELGFTKQV